MNHEELREKVADELTGCPIWENTANIGSEDAWGIADRVIRTVLSAVADDVDLQSRYRAAGLHLGAGVTCTPCAESDGLREAAERIRGWISPAQEESND